MTLHVRVCRALSYIVEQEERKKQGCVEPRQAIICFIEKNNSEEHDEETSL